MGAPSSTKKNFLTPKPRNIKTTNPIIGKYISFVISISIKFGNSKFLSKSMQAQTCGEPTKIGHFQSLELILKEKFPLYHPHNDFCLGNLN